VDVRHIVVEGAEALRVVVNLKVVRKVWGGCGRTRRVCRVRPVVSVRRASLGRLGADGQGGLMGGFGFFGRGRVVVAIVAVLAAFRNPMISIKMNLTRLGLLLMALGRRPLGFFVEVLRLQNGTPEAECAFYRLLTIQRPGLTVST
jgi:hypothetical protein